MGNVCILECGPGVIPEFLHQTRTFTCSGFFFMKRISHIKKE